MRFGNGRMRCGCRLAAGDRIPNGLPLAVTGQDNDRNGLDVGEFGNCQPVAAARRNRYVQTVDESYHRVTEI